MTTFKNFNTPSYFDVEPKVFVRRTEIHPSLLAGEANTLGWDVVNAVSIPLFNEDLKKSERYPKTFSLKEQNSWDLSGKFDPWYIVRGGSGAIIFMRTPINTVKMKMPKIPELTIDHGYVDIAIKLKFIQSKPTAADTPPDAPGTPQYLVKKATTQSLDDPIVTIYGIDYGDATPSDLQKTMFRAAMMQWYNAHLDTFEYLFSIVNINSMAAKDAFQWLAPTYTSYAYYNGTTDATSYLGVLNMVKNDSADGLSNQLSSNVIPEGANSSVAISNKSFLLNMVLPGLSKSFVNGTVSDFKMAGNNEIIENTKDVTLPDVTVNGVFYTPIIQKFTFQILGDEFQINTTVKVNVSAGVDLYIKSTNYYFIKLVDKPDGGQTLDFEESKTAEVTKWTDVASWVTITSIIIGIIGAVFVGIANGVIKETAKKVVAVIIIGIVAGLLAALPKLIGEVMKGNAAEFLPSIDLLVKGATKNVDWPQSSGFEIDRVELNGALLLVGNLKPA